MGKRSYFDVFDGRGWPSPNDLQHYFLAPVGGRWTFGTGNDNWALYWEGAEGTDHLEIGKGRIDIRLEMWGHPDLGVLIIYSKRGGGHKQTYTSRGDLKRL